jgi:hypothetical protein
VRRTRFLILAVLLLPCGASWAAAGNGYLAELVERSRQLRLAERPEWHKLLHYVPNLLLPGVHSLVDSPGFFNAPDGKNEPRAELEATLAAFFSEIEETDEQQNPQCAFIARYAWLDERLDFDHTRLPRRACTRFEQWRAALNPKGLTLVFPSAYLDNPASMFGHTLLRVDAKDQDERTRLLAYAVNFAANTDEKNGLVFAVKGLLGGYPGTFSILPYYVKVREYNDMENRDIWEYQLEFTPEEVDRVLMHAWELGPTYFQYFFFDENCSFHLLGLLQVAQPDLNLTDQFRWWAIPTDTVRALTERPGLVKRTVYRPANATLIKYRLDLMSEAERTLVHDLSLRRATVADASPPALPPQRAAAVLDTAQDYVNYRRAIGKNDVVDPDALARGLLLARSRVDADATPPQVPAPSVRPDQGHASSRVGLGAGRREERNYQDLTLRPTYHDIMDPEGGYIHGAQIEYFDLRLRHYGSSETRVERFVPVGIISLSPRDEFFQSWSWKIAAGWRRTSAETGNEPLAFALDGGAGAAWSSGAGNTLAYVLLDGSLRAHPSLVDGYALGVGPAFGVVTDMTADWRVHAYARGIRYGLGQLDSPWELGLQQRVSLSRDVALRIDIARKGELRRRFTDATISAQFYF